MTDWKAFGRRVAELRRETGIGRQEDLAALLEISRSTVASWESGGDSPGLPVLIKLADFFRVPLDYLLGRRVPKGGPLVGKFVEDLDELALIRFWGSLDKGQKTALTQLLRIDRPST